MFFVIAKGNFDNYNKSIYNYYKFYLLLDSNYPHPNYSENEKVENI